ncbi:putative MFS-type transporter [Hyphodiscus hymeniophilus]|uniref:MFS-type transporter n=1 Tax=Hyphodiscus hymeniophilus TaxID=353542 RepID=A0A9P6VH17_9HELO|nr:putative MFS-type transporter [Hyphodiscus hymeniophilus]
MASHVLGDKSFRPAPVVRLTISSEDESKCSSPSPSSPQDVMQSTESCTPDIGQQCPKEFHSHLHEIGFVFSVAMSQILTEYSVSGFTVILPYLVQNQIMPQESSIWSASVFSLAVASTTLLFGRLVDIYGGRYVYICGSAWLTIWSLVIGFSTNEVMINVSRALQGIGASAVLPSSLMLMGTIYRPGTRKNMVFSIYGACAPFGFFLGILFAGVAGDSTTWTLYFWAGAAFAAVTTTVAYFTIPQSTKRETRPGAIESSPERQYGEDEQQIKMDWIGAVMLFLSLNLILFALISLPQAPAGLVHTNGGRRMYYRHLRRTGAAWVAAPLLFAIAPLDTTYWAYVFPSMVCATIGIDITYNVCNIYITTSTPYNQQGFAGAMVAFLTHCGGTVCLALGNIVQEKTRNSLGERRSCQAVFWLEVGCAALATTILVVFVRIGEAKSDTVEETVEC